MCEVQLDFLSQFNTIVLPDKSRKPLLHDLVLDESIEVMPALNEGWIDARTTVVG
jgi:hypothetical protein